MNLNLESSSLTQMNPEPFPSQLGWIEQNKPRLNQKKSYAKKGKCLPTYLRTFCNWGLGFYTFGGATLRGVSANLTGSLSWIKCILTKVLPSIIRLVSKIACTQKPYFQYRFIEMYLSVLLSTHVKVIRITNHSFAKKIHQRQPFAQITLIRIIVPEKHQF